jgi:alcohol dehydrogenase class IV
MFEFATAHRIVFGTGSLERIGERARPFGTRALVVTGANPARAAGLLAHLERAGIAAEAFAIAGEPTLDHAREGAARARAFDAAFVVGFGGGSALDGAKAAAALAYSGGDPLDYVEVIGRGAALAGSLPVIAIPTTAGTGAEVTMNAVLHSAADRLKVSMRHPAMLPRLALVDPACTAGLPPEPTAFGGMDALTQSIEPFVSNKANPLTDGFAREGMMRAARSLRAACASGAMPAREDMALASLLGGLALANAKLGAVHGFASPLGGLLAAPHGAVCAALLAPVMHANIAAARADGAHAHTLERYAEVARILTGRADAAPEDGAQAAAALAADLGIPPLSHWGLREADLETVADSAARASSMAGNPVVLDAETRTAILRRAL